MDVEPRDLDNETEWGVGQRLVRTIGLVGVFAVLTEGIMFLIYTGCYAMPLSLSVSLSAECFAFLLFGSKPEVPVV